MNARASLPGSAFAVEPFRHAAEGCVAYVVTDRASGEAMVVDPRLDQLAALQAALRAQGGKLRWVVDTHTHADHLSGARQLAALTGAEHVVHVASRLRSPARRAHTGDHLALGFSEVRVIDAPGHTPDSLALHLEGHLFTGDALLPGGAGRTDFPGGSAADLFRTFRVFEALPEETVVHPGHDYPQRGGATLREERRTNPLLMERDEGRFLAAAERPAGAPPPGMAEVLRFNLAEPAPDMIGPLELDALLRGGAAPTIVDVRAKDEFASELLEGSTNLPLEEVERRLAEVSAQDVIVVCRSGVRASIAARTIRRHGRTARILDGGLRAWKAAGLPLARGRWTLAVDRQVQLIVGLGVLCSVGLGVLVEPWLLLLAALLGAGLTFAGATGTCGLARLLLLAPWNRPPASAPAAPTAVCAAPAAVCAAPPAPPAPPSS